MRDKAVYDELWGSTLRECAASGHIEGLRSDVLRLNPQLHTSLELSANPPQFRTSSSKEISEDSDVLLKRSVLREQSVVAYQDWTAAAVALTTATSSSASSSETVDGLSKWAGAIRQPIVCKGRGGMGLGLQDLLDDLNRLYEQVKM